MLASVCGAADNKGPQLILRLSVGGRRKARWHLRDDTGVPGYTQPHLKSPAPG